MVSSFPITTGGGLDRGLKNIATLLSAIEQFIPIAESHFQILNPFGSTTSVRHQISGALHQAFLDLVKLHTS